MAYYLRLLSKSADAIPVKLLRADLAETHPGASLTVEEGTAKRWTQLLVKGADGEEVAEIERNDVTSEPDNLGREEIAEFITDLAGAKPDSAVPWLKNYLSGVRTIYACQVLGDDGDLYNAVL